MPPVGIRGVDNFLQVCVLGGGGGGAKNRVQEIFSLPRPLLHDHTPMFGSVVMHCTLTDYLSIFIQRNSSRIHYNIHCNHGIFML